MINIVRGEGSTLYDDEGNSYIDGLASLWYCQIGHGRAEMADAVAAQMRDLACYNTFDPFTNPPAARGGRDDRRAPHRSPTAGCSWGAPAPRPSTPPSSWPASTPSAPAGPTGRW